MKKNLLQCVAYFLVGILVMQILFTGKSKNVNASHSESSQLLIASNMEIKNQYKVADLSLPKPFDMGCTSANHCFFIKEAGKSNYTTCYCIGYDKKVSNQDGLTSNLTLDKTEARLLNYAMNYGFNKEDFDVASGTKADVNQYFATQTLIWFIKANIFSNDEARTKTEEYFFKVWPSIKDNYKQIYEKVKYQEMAPSYINDTGYVLKWNASTSKYELTLENTYTSGSNSANATVKVDESTLPSGVTAKVEGEKLIISSTSEITSEKAITLTKAPEVKGKLVAWNNSDSSKQPQISLDYGEESLKKVMEIKIKTSKESSEVAPPEDSTPEPTPTVPSGTAPESTIEPTVEGTPLPTSGPKVEATNKPTEGSKDKVTLQEKEYSKEVKSENMTELDEAPKTADETNLDLALKLLGASGIAMLLSAITIFIRKRKERI